MRKVIKTILLCLIVTMISGCIEKKENAGKDSVRPVMVINLSKAMKTDTKRFTGVIQSAQQAALAFRVPGCIDEINVIEGQKVCKDELLANLDPHDYQLDVLMCRARLIEAEAANKLAFTEYNRLKNASEKNAVAKVKLERAESMLEQSTAAIDVARQSLGKAESTLSYTILKAPFNGVVARIYKEDFEQVSPGIPVIELIQPEKPEAAIDVPERFISKFSLGQKGFLTWHGALENIEAEVTEIASVPSPLSKTYTVTFSVLNYSEKLIHGKSVAVDVSFKDSEESVCIPYEAILRKENKNFVFAVKDSRAHLHEVEILKNMEKNVCIRNGLGQDESVVVAGLHFLKDGQIVGKQIPVE
ncbi:MAG: efflux RND transporter periplasmic adaptor subunit [Desulforegulaceae bacterium]|nr:efflux RND transporter periplasmic adaptor subunit [Desulforegulaceae bacterium]